MRKTTGPGALMFRIMSSSSSNGMGDEANKITKTICRFDTPFGRYVHSSFHTSSSIAICNLFSPVPHFMGSD